MKNYHNLKARALKGMILDSLGRSDEAEAWYAANLELDAFDYVSHIESGDVEGALKLMNGRVSSFIEAAIDYAEAGYYTDAVDILDRCPEPTPMVFYHKALYLARMDEDAAEALAQAAAASPLYCFPNKLEDILALEHAIRSNPADSKAPYYLGCLFYDRRRFDEAIALWEKSAGLDPNYPTVWRNLALAYFNKRKAPEKAREALEKAYALDESDARVLLELDQLYHKLNVSLEERFAFLDQHRDVAFQRDDLYVEYCALLNHQGEYEKALDLIMAHHFHPWEGGEGKVTTQYAVALKQLAKRALNYGDPREAKRLLSAALVFPHNLGEGKLEGAKDNDIYYYLGLAERALGNEEAAVANLKRAAAGNEEPASAMYYNDQPAELILYEGLASRALGDEDHARSRFYKLISYGEKHYYDQVKIDYFAVSLPDLQLFESDLTVSNRAHCEYLIALGSYGLGDMARAEKCFDAVLDIDNEHQGALLHRRLIEEK